MAVPGSVVGVGKLITPGGQQGPKGDAGTAANVPLADITQNGLLRQTPGLTTSFVDGTNNYQSLTTAVQPVIWSARLRSTNSVGNSNFECDQVNCTALYANVVSGTRMVDRWFWNSNGTMKISSQSISEFVNVPGTNFMITCRPLKLTLTTAQASLAAANYAYVGQNVEGPLLRELFNDVHSVSILIKSTVANLSFSYLINDPTYTHSYTKLCTIPSANTWTLITIPNIPIFAAAGTWGISPGTLGYTEGLCFGSGTTNTSSVDGAWVNAGALASPGTSNWFSNSVNAAVEIAFVQHEPGSLCTTLIDKPFAGANGNLDECLRYYSKTYSYGVKPGTVSYLGCNSTFWAISTASAVGHGPFKKPMAKPPTVVAYNPNTGTANSIVNPVNSANAAVSSVDSVGDSGFFGFLGTFTSGSVFAAHYTADTGW